MVEKIVPHTTSICMDCGKETDKGTITVSADEFDLKQGIFSVEGDLIEKCKKHHDHHRWGKKTDQHNEFVLEHADNSLIGTVTVSTECRRFTILSLNAKIRSALTGE